VDRRESARGEKEGLAGGRLGSRRLQEKWDEPRGVAVLGHVF